MSDISVTPANTMHTEPILIAQSDDPEILEWLANADQFAGGFLRSFARAALVADHTNYPLIRPLVLTFIEKYPKYQPTDAVKEEIAAWRKRQP